MKASPRLRLKLARIEKGLTQQELFGLFDLKGPEGPVKVAA